MLRVVKPGGIILVDVPFLQPYHGYPHHYYNMTTHGLRNLFGKNIRVLRHGIEQWEKPIHALTWFLEKYVSFIQNPATRERFLNTSVRDIIKNGPDRNLEYVKHLDKNKEEIIACGSLLIAEKIDNYDTSSETGLPVSHVSEDNDSLPDSICSSRE